jgi:hypothetical protein
MLFDVTNDAVSTTEVTCIAYSKMRRLGRPIVAYVRVLSQHVRGETDKKSHTKHKNTKCGVLDC